MEISLSFFLTLLVLIHPSSARVSKEFGVSDPPHGVAEKLIKQLNLLPKDAVAVMNVSSSKSKIVENIFRFPGLMESGDSLKELGHHAGYYRIRHSHAFVSCSPDVYDAMQMDWMKNLEVGIPALLKDGIKSLIYAGEYDLICNWLGNSRWVHAMEWDGQKEFAEKSTVPYMLGGAEVGVLKSHGPLSFLKVHNAGHMVPMDQPKVALDMLRRWTHGALGEPAINPRTAMQ